MSLLAQQAQAQEEEEEEEEEATADTSSTTIDPDPDPDPDPNLNLGLIPQDVPASSGTSGSSSSSSNSAFESILAYDWDSDGEFQSGLESILAGTRRGGGNGGGGDGRGDGDMEEVMIVWRAKCYYYSRISGLPVSFDLFREYLVDKGKGKAVGTYGIGQASTSSGPMPGRTLGLVSHEQDITPASSPPQKQDPPPPPPPPPHDPEATAPLPMSFAHIVELITTGQPIPGIREVPDKISEEEVSESAKENKKKPWESV